MSPDGPLEARWPAVSFRGYDPQGKVLRWVVIALAVCSGCADVPSPIGPARPSADDLARGPWPRVGARLLGAAMRAPRQPPALDAFSATDGPINLVFLGDSITQDGYWVAAVEDALLMRLPSLELTSHNAGSSGDRLGWRVGARLEADVLDFEPALVVAQFGMNDGGYAPASAVTVSAFREGLDQLVGRLAPRTTVLVASPTLYDALGPSSAGHGTRRGLPFYADVLAELGEVARDVADRHGQPFVDLIDPMETVTALLRGDCCATAHSLVPDGIHPNAAGGLVIAEAVVGAMIGPIDQSEVRLGCDGDGARGVREVLDFPFRASVPSVVRRGFARTHLRAFLVVDCLGPGWYDVFADDALVGTFLHEELRAGIFLSELAGVPWSADIEHVRLVSERRRQLFAETIRPAMVAAKRAAAAMDVAEQREAVFAAAVAAQAGALDEASSLLSEQRRLSGPILVHWRVAPAVEESGP